MLLDVRPDHLKIVCDILQAHVPQHEVWAFGSRAKWTAKDYSDLDLCIVSDQALGFSLLGTLAEDFSESDLPYKVDIVDWATTSENFRKIIERDKVVVQKGKRGAVSPAPTLNKANDWPIVRLGDHCIKIGSGATPKGGKEAYLDHGAYSLIRSQNIYNDGFKWDGLAYISDDQAKKLDGVAVCAGDVLLNITGDSVARVCSAPEKVIPARVNQHVAIIRPDDTAFDSRFIRYFLASPKQQDLLLGMASAGATRNALTKGMIEDLRVPKPSMAEQTEIAEVLSSLDDKISLLHETNATLEALAQALFKSWFVDFDPVRAKMEGRAPEGMDDATAALFPDSFEESELGLVPKGWPKRAIYDLATYINGAAYKAFKPNSERRGLPIIKIAELKNGVTSQTAFSEVAMPGKYRIETGDILFSWSGNPDTSIDTFVWQHNPAWLNQHIFRVIPHSARERPFVLQTLKHLRPIFAELARNKQTTGLGHVTVADMKKVLVTYPEESVLTAFGETVGVLHDRIFENERQAQTLAALRNTLLPRLISGQLRLPEAESMLETTA